MEEATYYLSDSCEVRAPAARCYELALAVRRYPQWWPIDCEPIGVEGRLRVGSRFRLRGARTEWTVTVTALAENRQIDLQYDGDMEGPVRWTFAPTPEGTVVRYAYLGVRPMQEQTRRDFASGRLAERHSRLMQEEVFAGMRRLLESEIDVTGGDLFESMFTMGAVRSFRSEPVSEALLREVIAGATRAASARNTQPWGFVAVTDPETRARLAEVYLQAWEVGRDIIEQTDADADIKDRADYGRMMRGVDELARGLADAPALIVVGLDTDRLGPMGGGGRIHLPGSAYASIFPAVQNLMLAARALGLGTTLTTLVQSVEGQVREILDMPAAIHVAALIPVGYPRRPFKPIRRRPLVEVAFGDRWGRPLSSGS